MQDSPQTSVAIIGAGLAGCECALTLARHGIASRLLEQKPGQRSPAHQSDDFAELVCSNSLRSAELTSGIGLLKQEMRRLGSAFIQAADATRIPAGKALAVDRAAFSADLTARIRRSPLVECVNARIDSLDDPLLAGFKAIVVAAGPLASAGLGNALAAIIGSSHRYFYDAIAPIVWTDSLDQAIVFRASRYDCESGDQNGESGDYLNCPMNREEYERFYQALCAGRTVPAHDLEGLPPQAGEWPASRKEAEIHFEGCMPIEALAARGQRTLTFGPLKPVGFIDPRTGKRPWAVLQLRAENAGFSTCNLVGCQTKLVQAEQERIFRLVPGMEKAEFVRFGSMHRNTYINAPVCLGPDLSLLARRDIFLAGQISGVEGYVESAASGLWLGLSLGLRLARGIDLPLPPAETALGSLLGHLRTPVKNFQPSNAHFGLMPELGQKAKKKERKALYSERAMTAFASWQESVAGLLPD